MVVEGESVSPMTKIEGESVSPMTKIEGEFVSPMTKIEGEFVSPMTKTSKIVWNCSFLSSMTIRRKLAGILVQKFNLNHCGD